jgi:hypothetical protein
MPAMQFGGGDASPLLASLRCPTPLAADAALRPCTAARFGHVRHLELRGTARKSRLKHTVRPPANE